MQTKPHQCPIEKFELLEFAELAPLEKARFSSLKVSIASRNYLLQEPEDKHLIIAVSNLNQLAQLNAILTSTAIKLSNKFHPGQLNLIIPASNDKTIAFRIPSNNILFELAMGLNKPTTTTSANIHNLHPIYKLEELKQQFQNKVPLIIYAGDLNPDIPVSTVYNTTDNKLIRQGLITQEQIREALK